MNDVFGLVGHTIEGRYLVERVVAEGGFGVVYRATHRALGRAVALKVLKVPDALSADARRSFVEQFQREAQLISQLEHPAIVDVTDFGIVTFEDGLEAPWMALEWVDGPTLAADLARRRGRGGRPPTEVLALIGPVLEALAVAHARGVAHRDLKPGNLMLPALDAAHAGPPGRASLSALPRMRVLDFGVAKELEGDEAPGSGQTRTRSSMLAYSPRYAAPEQQSQTRTGPWTDVHALGLILTEMLVDAAPYVGQDKLQLHIQVLAQVRPTPGHFGVDVGAWEPVLAKAMALVPQDRFANAGELLDALEAQLPGAYAGGGTVAQTRTVPVAGLARPTGLPSEVLPVPPVAKRSGRGAWVAGASALGLILVGAVAVRVNRGPGAPAGPPPGRPAPATPPARPTEAAPHALSPGAPEASPPPLVPAAVPPRPLTPPGPDASVTPEPTHQALTPPRERRAHEARERDAARAARANVARPPPPAAPPGGGGGDGMSPMERVSQCQAAGGGEPARNSCIIGVLRGRATTEQELRMLAVTYQVVGNRQEAIRTMRTYIQRYPHGSMANDFSQYILRNTRT